MALFPKVAKDNGSNNNFSEHIEKKPHEQEHSSTNTGPRMNLERNAGDLWWRVITVLVVASISIVSWSKYSERASTIRPLRLVEAEGNSQWDPLLLVEEHEGDTETIGTHDYLLDSYAKRQSLHSPPTQSFLATHEQGSSAGFATVRTNDPSGSVRKYAASHSFLLPQPGDDPEAPKATTPKRVLNIHVVPHTHDDVGWLKTVDQLYNGWNNTIQKASVREIISSVVEALTENPSRTFCYVEIKFFSMWWAEQTEQMRETVMRLVKETKQLTFVNGGWCMHDEGSTHYTGMIDQTTLGHDFLKRTFGYVPTVGWQLDPFGHSSTQASLMTYKTGFDAIYFGRIDYQDREKRHATKNCEGLWNTYTNRDGDDDEGGVFWGLTGSYTGNYQAPGGYCLDVNCGPGQKSFIDKNRKEIIAMVEDFLLAVRQQSDRTKGDHVMLTMGSDFQYQRAAVNFANLDLIIGTVTNLQKDGTIDIPEMFGPEYDAIHMFYSSPEYYTKCKHEEVKQARTNTHATDNEGSPPSSIVSRDHRVLRTPKKDPVSSSASGVEWATKRDDFFPYSDCPNCFWTGYFTSRPSLKRFERATAALLLGARQVISTSVANSRTMKSQPESSCGSCEDELLQLEDAVGVMQHHDAVSGTSKQHVAYDYAKILQGGINALLPCLIRKLKHLLLGDDSEMYLTDLTYCQLLNETVCEPSVTATSGIAGDGNDVGSNGGDLYAVVYNSLASNRSALIDLPVGTPGRYLVEDVAEGNAETMEALPNYFRPPERLAKSSGPFVLSFTADSLPAVGAKVFRIRKHSDAIIEKLNQEGALDGGNNAENTGDVVSTPSMADPENTDSDGLMEISNGRFSVAVDTDTGAIRRIGTQHVENLSSWGYYISFDREKDTVRPDADENSGAYIFRPSTPNQKLRTVSPTNATIVHTLMGTEIRTRYEESWISTKTRIRKDLPYVEIEYQVGPIPIGDGRGKEVVTRYNTMVNNDATFYTDSNGREFIKRQRNYRPTWDLTVFEPVAGNYYPINTAIYIEEQEVMHNEKDSEKTAGPAFAVLTDRSQGGGSIVDGTIELMVHRRTIGGDDHKGVGEPINETDVGITPCAPYGNATRIGEGLVIRGKHRILVGNDGERLARSVMDDSFADPLVFVGTNPTAEEFPFHAKSFSGITKPLPMNVMLITKRPLYKADSTEYLVRLGHQYGERTDVDLSLLFPREQIDGFRETTLSGNRDIEDWKRQRFDWAMLRSNGERGTTESLRQERRYSTKSDSTIISLEAMDIRTFVVTVK